MLTITKTVIFVAILLLRILYLHYTVIYIKNNNFYRLELGGSRYKYLEFNGDINWPPA